MTKEEKEAVLEKYGIAEELQEKTNLPLWLNERGGIDEVKFCDMFIKREELKCINKKFYSIDGLIADEEIESKIHAIISPHIKQRIARRVQDLVNALKIYSYSPKIDIDVNNIHLENGTLNLDGNFSREKFFCLNRLNVSYTEEEREPENWLNFLSDLLYEEDIKLLQEFIGYCLLPTNKGQAMLIMTGTGGEGKSRIGIVLKAIFGDSAIFGKVQDFEISRFALASLENKLLFIDDDMNTTGLRDTGTLKNIITAETELEIERKGKQKQEANIYAKLILLGNGLLQALYDHTEGFYRRQIIIEVKPKSKERKDDKSLIDKLLSEKELIFKWAFRGLQNLIENGYYFSVSQHSQEAFENMKRESFNFIEFLEDDKYITFGEDKEITSKALVELYELWCKDNSKEPSKGKTVLAYLKNNLSTYDIQISNSLKGEDSKRVRGFIGIGDNLPI